MIQGLGIDVVELNRIRDIIEKRGKEFLERVFTDEEIRYCDSKKIPYQHFAARFAAKEAMSKAISTGWRGEFRWKDVEISNDTLGQPMITLHGALARKLGNSKTLLSLSHSDNAVVAIVLIEARELEK